MGNETKLTAKQARSITDASTFVENVIFKNINSEAQHGRSTYQYGYDFEDPMVLKAIVTKLIEYGYDVTDHNDYDESTGLIYGSLIISW